MSLRDEAMEAMAEAMEPLIGAGEYNEDGLAKAALDALLNTLDARAEEWSAAEVELHKRLGWEGAWHSRHEDELRHLVEVLRATDA